MIESKEFSLSRRYLGKTQGELARLLCVSTKAVQSFEGGQRKVPVYAERQLLVLLSLKKADGNGKTCWEINNCPSDWRDNCPAWEFKAGHHCWFLNGTFCQGRCQDRWGNKIKICRQCKVFVSMIPTLIGNRETAIHSSPNAI